MGRVGRCGRGELGMLPVLIEGLVGMAALAAMWLLLRSRRRHIGGAPVAGTDQDRSVN